MRVAMLAPIAWRTPPHAYGPWELATSVLTERLVARGLDVTLFATLDSRTAATLAGVVPLPYNDDPAIDAKVWEMLHVAHVFERAGEFDLIHNQADFVPLAFSRTVDVPIVMTIHGRPSSRILPILRHYGDRASYVAISDTDRSAELNYAATIPHGVDVDAFPFVATPGEDLLFFGRIHPDKGTAAAIRIAHAAGRRLHIAGIVQDDGYWSREVAPHIDGDRVVWHGALGGSARLAALGSAFALLHPIDFDEPFGLSVAEALACGTPVIAFRRGSMEMLVRDGETGFVVDDEASAIAAVAAIPTIDRAACRADVAARFSVDTMTDRYIELYDHLVHGASRTTRAEVD